MTTTNGKGGSSRTMRAAVIEKPGRIGIMDVPIPEPAAGEVRVRLEGCGVCASNLSPWEGQPWFEYPMRPGAPGHEGWGEVESVGEAVSDISIGDRVALLSGAAYGEYDVAPADQVVRLPPELAGRPFPGEPIGCAMNIFERAAIESGQTVAVVGAGFLGLLLTRLATAAGARVIAISRRPYALEMARAMGADETIPMNDHWEIINQVRDLTDGAFCDTVIEAVGKQWPLDLSAELTRERGRLVIAGYHQDGPRQVNMQLWNWRGLDVINAHERAAQTYVNGMRAAVEAIVSGAIDPYPLFTTYPLDRLAEALDDTRDRPDGVIKALVTIA